MSDTAKYTFSYNFSQTPPNPPAASAEAVMVQEVTEIPLPQNTVLLVGRLNGRRALVTQDVAYALHFCCEFRSYSEHARLIARELSEFADSQEELVGILRQLHKTGLLVSATELSGRIIPAANEALQQEPLSVCILTCDRPKALARLLESFAGKQGLEATPVVVIDDSRDPTKASENQRLVEQKRQQLGIGFEYFGATRQERYLQALIDALPQHRQALTFLIGRFADPGIASYGRVRNLATLLTAGRRAVVIDDDLVLHLRHTPAALPGLAISALPREAIFFDSSDDWPAHDEGIQPFHSVRQYLGNNLGGIAALTGLPVGPAGFKDLLPNELELVRTGTRARITTCGLFGEPGTASNAWIWEAGEFTRRSLLRSESAYQRALVDRNLWTGRRGPHVNLHFTLMSQFTGLDNREITPPCFPVYRNEDYLFGEMMQCVHSDTVVFEFPWAPEHRPIPRRQWEAKAIETPTSCSLLDFTADYLGPLRQQRQSTPAACLRSIAYRLMDLAGQPTPEIARAVAEYNLQLRAARVRRRSKVLEETAEAPAAWRRDLQQGIKVNRDALLAGPDFLRDTALATLDSDSPTNPRVLWRQFAAASAAWPDIHAAACALVAASAAGLLSSDP